MKLPCSLAIVNTHVKKLGTEKLILNLKAEEPPG